MIKKVLRSRFANELDEMTQNAVLTSRLHLLFLSLVNTMGKVYHVYIKNLKLLSNFDCLLIFYNFLVRMRNSKVSIP